MGGNIITGPEAGSWVADRINGSYDQDSSVAIGLKRGDEIVAAVLYEDWNGRSLVAHIAVTGRMTRYFLFAIFHHPFVTCGAHKVICPIPYGNQRSMDLARKMGFQLEAMISDACPTGHIYLFTITKPECRFLKERYGKEQTSTAAAD